MPHVWEMAAMERRYSVPPSTISEPMGRPHPTEDLHAWSIYRQNLNSDFTDSALGSSEKSPLPYGNFQLRESTVHSILSHPKYGPHGRASDLGPNMFTYLKFGLPRVFPPPRGLREGSSGYDSSDDGGSPYMDREGRFRRSRSDPDFRNHIIRRQEIGSGSETTWWRDKKLRSNSEANLLNQDLYSQQQGKTGERRAAERSDISTHKTVASSATAARRAQGAASKAGSQISVASHVTRSHVGVFGGMVHSDGLYGADGHLINEKFFPKDSLIFASDESALKHPHLQVRGLTYEEPHNVPWKLGLLRRRVRILENLTFEVRSGELLGIMATNEYEGTALLNVLASKKIVRRSRVRADIIVNGTRIPLKLLKDRIAYVQQDCNFAEDMSVRQTMLFASLLQEPGNQMRSYDTKGRINALIEDMGLGLVKHTRVKNLTMSEKRRLNVACRLLLDTDIVLLDLPTKGMDIFDTFFLIEYLRQWASRGRIVIVTIQPPTYEIFTMLTEVALISTGRMMYFGRRREMLPYFAFIEYPCPAYKNPADYYLDLVTLDNLSPEAMLESSQRVDLLAETFRRRQEALSDPGPPSLPPPKFKRAGLLVQILALWIRALIYMFPYNLITFARNIIIAAGLSVLIGAIYYNVRLGREQEHILDRFAFHYVMMGVAIWPIILLTITEVWSLKDAIVRDISDGLYWKSSYIITKMQYSFLSAGGVFLAYVIPAYCMAGLKNEVDNITFSIYIGYILMYLYAIRALSMAMAYMCQSRHVAAIYIAVILTFVIMCSGYPVHLQDLSIILSWFQWASPMKWVMEQLDIWDIARTTSRNLTFICSRNPVVVQEQPRNGLQGEQTRIMLRSECGIQTGAQALAYFSFQESLPFYFAIVVTFAFWSFWQIILFIAFFNCHQSQKKSRTRYLRIFQ